MPRDPGRDLFIGGIGNISPGIPYPGGNNALPSPELCLEIPETPGGKRCHLAMQAVFHDCICVTGKDGGSDVALPDTNQSVPQLYGSGRKGADVFYTTPLYFPVGYVPLYPGPERPVNPP